MIADTRTYISRVYGRSRDLFTTASPYSQILEVLAEITNLVFFYIEDATVEQNILTAQDSTPGSDIIKLFPVKYATLKVEHSARLEIVFSLPTPA